MIIVLLYLFLHSPAFMMLFIGYLYKKNNKPQKAKILFILAGIYFIIGGGICGAILNDLSKHGI